MPPSFTDVFDNPDDFNFLGLNTAKYFYDLSLVRERDWLDEPINKDLLKHDFLSKPLLVIISLLKLIYLLITNRNKIIFYGSPNHLIKEGGTYFDLYNYNIVKDIGLNKTLIIQDRRDIIKKKTFSPTINMDDIVPLFVLIKTFLKISLKKELLEFKVRNGRKLKILGFSEDESITKILVFYSRYLFFSFFLSIIKPKSALVICHYSKHAFTTACKRLKIPVVELMHGAILPNQKKYYNLKITPEFATAFRKGSLPDLIAVYGDYWKKELIDGKMFSENSIINIGYYQKLRTIDPHSIRTNRRKTILIASDFLMQTYFLNYIKFLKTKLDQDKYRIIIKLHPAEDGRLFTEVVDNQLVFLETTDIYELFNQADVLISVYSTVLFEATLYNLRSYSLFIPKYQKECEMTVKTGVAQRLDPDQIPDFRPIGNTKKGYFLDTYNFNNISRLLGIEK